MWMENLFIFQEKKEPDKTGAIIQRLAKNYIYETHKSIANTNRGQRLPPWHPFISYPKRAFNESYAPNGTYLILKMFEVGFLPAVRYTMVIKNKGGNHMMKPYFLA